MITISPHAFHVSYALTTNNVCSVLIDAQNKLDAENLLDWLEANHCPEFELSVSESGYAIHFSRW